MRIRTQKSHQGSLMYIFEFENKDTVDAFFNFYENIAKASLSNSEDPENEVWLHKFEEVIQKLKGRTNETYGYEGFPYSGFLFYDEITTWIFGMEDVVCKQFDQIEEMSKVIDIYRKALSIPSDDEKNDKA